MTRIRANFRDELKAAERGLLSEGALVLQQLSKVMKALQQRDVSLAEQIVAEDDLVDDLYLEIDARILNLIALQAPVARDLRLVSALLHSNVHLERMGDLCVNVAKFVSNGHSYPAHDAIMISLQDMGVRAGKMIELALRAFSSRSVELAEQLPEADDAIDRLNRGMLHHLRDHIGDEDSYEWAVQLLLVARYLERIGDHAVDIGEQTSFLVTGAFREFTDASHEVIPRSFRVVSQRGARSEP
jgi:phosphate transport system protein